MNKVYLLLGANMGDVRRNIVVALLEIEKHIGTIVAISNIYKTAAWGITNQPDYLNQGIVVDTNFSSTEVLAKALAIEQALGRIRDNKKWEARLIDIDIIFFNNEIIDLPNLKIPHPYMHERKFVLAPIAELNPNFIHPIFNKSIQYLFDNCSDKLLISKLD
jgi:2-amino-4-hydroxy-6-hydroxymethyldihydropteridine diphosphokinase